MTALWTEEAGDPEHPLIVVIHGSMDRSAGMLKLSRRLDADFRVLRYDRRGYGRSFPHDGPFTMDDQVDDLLALLAGRQGRLDRSQLRRQCRAGDRRSSSRSGCWRGGLRDAVVVGAVVARHDGRFDRRRRGGQAERGCRAVHASNPRRSALGGAPGTEQGDAPRRRLAMVEELADLRRNQPWVASNITVPVITSFGSLGAPHHRDGMRYAATLLDCPVVELPDCRHDAPLSHPDLFRSRSCDPLVQVVGPPWSQ